jgi:VCBS repeat-containing protein
MQTKNLVLTLGKKNKAVLVLQVGEVYERIEVATCDGESKSVRLSIRATEHVKIKREQKITNRKAEDKR